MTPARHEQPLTDATPTPRSRRAALGALVLMAAVAGLVIGLAHTLTAARIEDNIARQTLAALSAVLPPALYDNEPHRDVILRQIPVTARPPVALPIYRARRSGEPVAAVLTLQAPNGYAGPIRLLVAMHVDGHVIGVRVIEHRETPGIGDAIDHRRSAWTQRLNGLAISMPPFAWRLRKDDGAVDQISGATVSSRAVLNATRAAAEYFTTHRQTLFSAPAMEPRP